jgi:hypothetical protein
LSQGQLVFQLCDDQRSMDMCSMDMSQTHGRMQTIGTPETQLLTRQLQCCTTNASLADFSTLCSARTLHTRHGLLRTLLCGHQF